METEQRRQRIKENIVKFHQIEEEMSYHGELLDGLGTQSGNLLLELYQDRPKKYIRDVLAIVQEMAEKEGEGGLKNTCDDLISSVKDWLEKYDEFIDERLSYSKGKQLAMLKGEIE